MFLGGGAGYQDIVYVDKTEVETSKNFIHEPLECLSCVPETKGHAQRLKQAKGCGDGRFGDVLWLYRNLVVCTNEVNVGEDGGTLECSSEVMEVGHRVPVRNGGIVESTEVATWSPVPSSALGNHVQGR